MRLALGFNADLPVAEIAEYASLADASGYDSFWMHEHSFGRDAVSFLEAAATITKNIKIGVACFSPYTRHPVAIAMTAATLQESSKGRMLLGLGTGFPMRLDLMGIKHEKPIGAIRDAIRICRGVWSGNPLSHSGSSFEVKNVKSLLGRTENIPIYIAGWKSQMLSLTGWLADGYVAKGGESTVSMMKIVSSIGDAAKGAKRSISQIDVGAYLLCLVEKSKDIALERAKKDPFVTYMMAVQDDYLYEGTGIDPKKKRPIAENYFKGKIHEASSHVSREMLDAFVLVGTREDVISRLQDYKKTGVNLPILQPISLRKEDVSEIIATGKELI